MDLCFDKIRFYKLGFINKSINQFINQGFCLYKKRPLLPCRFTPALRQQGIFDVCVFIYLLISGFSKDSACGMGQMYPLL